jgi:hypothetical protein
VGSAAAAVGLIFTAITLLTVPRRRQFQAIFDRIVDLQNRGDHLSDLLAEQATYMLISSLILVLTSHMTDNAPKNFYCITSCIIGIN